MIFLEPDGLVSFVAGVESEKRERDDDMPNVSGAAMNGHRVFVMPFMS